MNNFFNLRKGTLSLIFIFLLVVTLTAFSYSSEFGIGGSDRFVVKNFYNNFSFTTINVANGSGYFLEKTGDTMNGTLNMGSKNITDIDTIFMKTTVPCSGITTEGALCWDSVNHVLNMVTGLGNVVQLSQENFMVVKNTAGKTIYAGQIVSISNSSGTVPHVYIASANASTPTLHNLAMVTIPSCNNNAECVVTNWGLVHDLNTAAFVEGDEIYLSSANNGNFTKTKQTYPNYDVHVGTVIVSHATQGIVLFGKEFDFENGVTLNSLGVINNLQVGGNFSVKRPYGMFSSTETQSVAVINTPYPITFNWTEDNYQVYKSSDNANFSFGQTGDYLIELSIIVQSSTPGSRAYIWVQKNGVNIPRSTTIYDFKGTNANTVIAVPFILDMNTTDKFRIMYSGDNTGVKVQYITNTSFAPETPSAIMTITKVSELHE